MILSNRDIRPGDLFEYKGYLTLPVYVKNESEADGFSEYEPEDYIEASEGVTLMFMQYFEKDYSIFYVVEHNTFTCFLITYLDRLVRI